MQMFGMYYAFDKARKIYYAFDKATKIYYAFDKATNGIDQYLTRNLFFLGNNEFMMMIMQSYKKLYSTIYYAQLSKS